MNRSGDEGNINDEGFNQPVIEASGQTGENKF